MSVPHSLSGAQIKRFRRWLEHNGAEILKAASYELLRVRIRGNEHALTKNKKRTLAWSRDLAAAYYCHANRHSWSGTDKNKDEYNGPAVIKAIMERDGPKCFYCNIDVPKSERTVEHLVSRAHGGPNHLSNLFLAHSDCNQAAGSLSAAAKLNIRNKHYA